MDWWGVWQGVYETPPYAIFNTNDYEFEISFNSYNGYGASLMWNCTPI